MLHVQNRLASNAWQPQGFARARIPEQNGGRAERHLDLLAIGHFRLSMASGLPLFCVRLHGRLALAQGLATAASREPELRTRGGIAPKSAIDIFGGAAG